MYQLLSKINETTGQMDKEKFIRLYRRIHGVFRFKIFDYEEISIFRCIASTI